MSKMGKAHSLFGSVAPVGQSLSHVFKDRDQQRAVISPWRRWYKTSRWQEFRYRVLSRDLFTCQMCGVMQTDTSLLVADHKIPHRGDADLFWNLANLWCLCAACHNSTKQSEERAR